jgi:4-aminobutyrate aminotransferase-like enzyme
MDLLRDAGMPVAAFIAEPIVGCAGQVPLAKGYLKHIYPFIRQAGGVCISDEVQTGFGRVGSAFWGFEMQEVVPDIVVLGKPMGNGHPLAAVVTTDAIAASFDNGMEFFSSFGGNPVSCAIGMAVLEVIEEEGLQEHAQRTGAYFMKLLKELMAEFECVGDVRGAGLFLGVELVTDRNSKNHNPELASRVKNELRNNNILVSTDGPRDNIIKMKPPLCFDNRNADRVVEEMFRIFKLIL